MLPKVTGAAVRSSAPTIANEHTSGKPVGRRFDHGQNYNIVLRCGKFMSTASIVRQIYVTSHCFILRVDEEKATESGNNILPKSGKVILSGTTPATGQELSANCIATIARERSSPIRNAFIAPDRESLRSRSD
jgi:hypothetical protein